MYRSWFAACSSEAHVGCNLQFSLHVKLLSSRRSETIRHFFFVSPLAMGFGTSITLWLNELGCSNARFVRTSSSTISNASSAASGASGLGGSNSECFVVSVRNVSSYTRDLIVGESHGLCSQIGMRSMTNFLTAV